MGNDNVIFFAHHRNNTFEKWNFLNFKRLNKNWDVIPIGFDKYNLLHDSIKVNRQGYPSNDILISNYCTSYDVEWAESDLLHYEAYLRFPDYEKYLFIEWDCVTNVSVDNFFNTNRDFFGTNVHTHVDDDSKWEFVVEYKKTGGKATNLASAGQMACIFYKNHIIKQAREEVLKNKTLYNNMFSEIRVGTVVRKFAEIVPARSDINKFISWHKEDLIFEYVNDYFFHPVKSFEEMKMIKLKSSAGE